MSGSQTSTGLCNFTNYQPHRVLQVAKGSAAFHNFSEQEASN
jgi:hypothetical protein